jgi:hypothetical protein
VRAYPDHEVPELIAGIVELKERIKSIRHVGSFLKFENPKLVETLLGYISEIEKERLTLETRLKELKK